VGILIERNPVHDHTKRAPLPGTRSNRTPAAVASAIICVLITGPCAAM
jgi:hypothetical protein